MRTAVTPSMVRVVDTSKLGHRDDAFSVVKSLVHDSTHITTALGHIFEVGRGPVIHQYFEAHTQNPKRSVDDAIIFLLVWSPPGLENEAGKILNSDLQVLLEQRGASNA